MTDSSPITETFHISTAFLATVSNKYNKVKLAIYLLRESSISHEVWNILISRKHRRTNLASNGTWSSFKTFVSFELSSYKISQVFGIKPQISATCNTKFRYDVFERYDFFWSKNLRKKYCPRTLTFSDSTRLILRFLMIRGFGSVSHPGQYEERLKTPSHAAILKFWNLHNS